MELLDLNWVRLVLDGPPQSVFLTVFALPVVGVPILGVTLAAYALDYISAKRGVAIIGAFLVLWFATFLIFAGVG